MCLRYSSFAVAHGVCNSPWEPSKDLGGAVPCATQHTFLSFYHVQALSM